MEELLKLPRASRLAQGLIRHGDREKFLFLFFLSLFFFSGFQANRFRPAKALSGAMHLSGVSSHGENIDVFCAYSDGPATGWLHMHVKGRSGVAVHRLS